MNNLNLAVQLFLQLAVILLFCRVVGAVAARFGQPQVVAEMIAGVMLGPSLFGLVWPDAQQGLFPWDKAQKIRDTQSNLFPLSQLGLAAYMFVVGLEFRMDIVRKRLHSSVAVSAAGMVVPFALGAGLAWVFFYHTDLFPKRTSLTEAMLFLGASMCITAFPMLARIISFKRLTGTTMGTVALGAAGSRHGVGGSRLMHPHGPPAVLAVSLAARSDSRSRSGVITAALTAVAIIPRPDAGL